MNKRQQRQQSEVPNPPLPLSPPVQSIIFQPLPLFRMGFQSSRNLSSNGCAVKRQESSRAITLKNICRNCAELLSPAGISRGPRGYSIVYSSLYFGPSDDLLTSITSIEIAPRPLKSIFALPCAYRVIELISRSMT